MIYRFIACVLGLSTLFCLGHGDSHKDLSVELPGEVELKMVWIEPGEFVMGSPSGETEAFRREEPQTKVQLTQGFWLGKTPVTQEQWEAVMQTNVLQQRNKTDMEWGLRGEGPDYPMYYVSWREAMEFCRKLTERERAEGQLPEGYVYTLPSEAQWEYAARAGTTTHWSFGNREDSLGDYAWYYANSRGQAQPVASKRANPWGLYDIHGNVEEWTRSRFSEYPGGSVVDYEGPDSGAERVSRGGSWDFGAPSMRSAIRHGSTPDLRFYNLGFRLALTPEP